jgi:glucokinase
MTQFSIGIDIGGTNVVYGLFDNQKKIFLRMTHPSNASCSPIEFFDEIIANIRKMLEKECVEKSNVKGVGLGMPSFINFEECHINKTSNLINIHDFPARSYIMKNLDGIRVILDNDAHAAAIAEHRLGAGRGFNHMLYCPVGTGISSGIIINGSIFRGSYGWAGESGHMIISPDDGVECGCENRGCFMSWCSGSMIIRHIQNWIEAGEKSCITGFAGDEKMNCNHLAEAYNAGDLLARRAIAQMVKYMGVWTYNIYVTLNINCFVFGGGLIKLFRDLNDISDGLLNSIKREFDTYNKNSLPVFFKEAELSDVRSGDDFGIIGAAELLF